MEGFTISHLQEKPQSGSTEASPLLTFSLQGTPGLCTLCNCSGTRSIPATCWCTRVVSRKSSSVTELQALFFLEKQFQVRELQTDDGGIFSENEHSEPAASRTDSGFLFFCFFFFFAKDKLQAFNWKSEFWITYFCQCLPTLKMFLTRFVVILVNVMFFDLG